MKILVTGAGGLVGERVCQEWSAKHEIVGLVRESRPSVPIELEVLDLASEPRSLLRILDGQNPELIIHTAAVSQPQAFAREPERARKVNVEAAYWLAHWCRKQDRPMIAFSSDTRYPDAAQKEPPEGGWMEDAPAAPVNQYGCSKAEMEQVILDEMPEACLLRSSLLWGRSRPGQNSFSGWLLARYQQPGPVPVFHDNLRQPLAVSQLLEILRQLLENWCPGALNTGSRTLLSRVDFAELLFDHLELDPARLEAGATKDAGLKEAIPLSLPMNLDRLSVLLDGKLPTVKTALETEYPKGSFLAPA